MGDKGGVMWRNYLGNYVCCNDYFGQPVHWDAREDWYDPGILMRLVNKGILTPNQIFNCLSSDEKSHSKLKSKLISTYGKETNIKEAFSFYGH